MAHEVRNPLATALWTAELLARMSALDRGGARGEKMAGTLLRALGRVRQLVEDHFLSERLDAGGLPLRAEAHALLPVVEAAVARKAPDVGPVSVAVEGSAIAWADRTLLDRAIDALIAAAGRDGVAVKVVWHASGEHDVLRVEGAEVASESLADPSKGAPSDVRGRALALPLARRIAGALGGSLRVERGALELALPSAAHVGPAPERAG